MQKANIAGRTMAEWQTEQPLLQDVVAMREVWWSNPAYASSVDGLTLKLGIKDVEDADLRLRRFAPYIAKVFPETESTQGVIESPLQPVPRMQSELERLYQREIWGRYTQNTTATCRLPGRSRRAAACMRS